MPPDSAGTATAILSGQKTRLGVIGTSHAVEYEDCESSLLEENRLVSIFKHAQDQGKNVYRQCLTVNVQGNPLRLLCTLFA